MKAAAFVYLDRPNGLISKLPVPIIMTNFFAWNCKMLSCFCFCAMREGTKGST